jgi:hypothetical protein
MCLKYAAGTLLMNRNWDVPHHGRPLHLSVISPD